MKRSTSIRETIIHKYIIARCIASVIVLFSPGFAFSQSLQDLFFNPPTQSRPLIIWQWMDGLVNKEGITKDLEAFKDAGLAGVQNFQIGGEGQGYISDTTCAIGSNKWNEMMLWTMSECKRLGLSFGTHNCPGWSSSASPAVTPEYSMQKVVFASVKAEKDKHQNKALKGKYLLPRPEVDPKYDYYEDIAVLVLPDDSVVEKSDILDVTKYFDASSSMLSLPSSLTRSEAWKKLAKGVIVRFGHTTNGKTNEAQAPPSGRGLECDKMRREAVKYFWDSYPQKIIDLAGTYAGNTFNCIEIDSYEAGGQNWSVVLPDEFLKRKGYDIIPYLPAIAGKWRVGNETESKKFFNDLVDVVTSLFAENYYGYMESLAERTPGMRLMIEPYGTGGQSPFRVLDMPKILKASPNAVVATEFWNEPQTWGWGDMKWHEEVVRNMGVPLLYAEAFTCWPVHAWQDGPSSLKPMCDRAYCTGVNRMMLHAGAANPWTNVEPGMSFGMWGTQFVPGQTWWKAGGARAFFDYMARCQALLQQGLPTKKQIGDVGAFKTYLRQAGDTSIVFVCNPTGRVHAATIPIDNSRKQLEVWDPYSITMSNVSNTNAGLPLTIEPYGSRFIIVHPGNPYTYTKQCAENVLSRSLTDTLTHALPISGPWNISFPDVATVKSDTLFDWKDAETKDVRYFSGSATYTTTFKLSKHQLRAMRTYGNAWLNLGDVSDMAQVKVNGAIFPPLWKEPYGCNVIKALHEGINTLEITVTNQWANRMIGDEQEPDDIEWTEPFRYSYAPGNPIVGCFMKRIPDWLRDGNQRPSKGRKTVCSFKFFSKNSPLVSSGLKGPVSIEW